MCSKQTSLEKELHTKEKAWEKEPVSLDQQHTIQTKRSNYYKEEFNRNCAECDEAHKESNTLKTDLNSLNSDY